MYMQYRTRTLAAELLGESPKLIALVRESLPFTRLSAPARSLRIDGHAGRLWVLEGDLLLDEDELTLYSLRQMSTSSADLEDPVPSITLGHTASLVGISVGGQTVRWEPGHVLRYCVFRKSFTTPGRYQQAVKNLGAAASAWEDACGISFEHVVRFDDEVDVTRPPDDIDPSLVFTVRHVDAGGQFIAAAFFPTQPPARRRLLIDPSYFAADLEYDRIGVLRHELGHILGFRHEQIRSGAPAICPDESTDGVVELTSYDPKSVMHYFCGGVGSTAMEISELDRQGAAQVYGKPRKQA